MKFVLSVFFYAAVVLGAHRQGLDSKKTDSRFYSQREKEDEFINPPNADKITTQNLRHLFVQEHKKNQKLRDVLTPKQYKTYEKIKTLIKEGEKLDAKRCLEDYLKVKNSLEPKENFKEIKILNLEKYKNKKIFNFEVNININNNKKIKELNKNKEHKKRAKEKRLIKIETNKLDAAWYRE